MHKQANSNLGNTIRQARINANLTQDQIAQYLGYSHRSNVQRLETGKLELKAKHLILLATLLDIDLNQLKENSMKVNSPKPPKIETCAHLDVEEESYLNPCKFAGCDHMTSNHKNCGQQWREWCKDCGKLIYDSANEN